VPDDRESRSFKKADSITITAIEVGVSAPVEAGLLIERLHKMIRKKVNANLDTWIADAVSSLLASFASGIAKDEAAAHPANTQPWSNGQTEGQVNRLKMVKRQMYGRAKIDLLEARLIGAA
jgi:transposase